MIWMNYFLFETVLCLNTSNSRCLNSFNCLEFEAIAFVLTAYHICACANFAQVEFVDQFFFHNYKINYLGAK